LFSYSLNKTRKEIPEIERLLEADRKNVQATKQLYADYHPYLPEALDEAAALFKKFSRAYSQQAQDDEDGEGECQT